MALDEEKWYTLLSNSFIHRLSAWSRWREGSILLFDCSRLAFSRFI